jgi:hypothetical protein
MQALIMTRALLPVGDVLGKANSYEHILMNTWVMMNACLKENAGDSDWIYWGMRNLQVLLFRDLNARNWQHVLRDRTAAKRRKALLTVLGLNVDPPLEEDEPAPAPAPAPEPDSGHEGGRRRVAWWW